MRPKALFQKTKSFQAVKSISFDLKEGEVLGIVGESGSGKSTTAKAIAGLIPYQKGQVLYQGNPLQGFHSEIQMIFQDPASSLNPRMSIFRNVSEGLVYKQNLSQSEKLSRCEELLKQVDLDNDYLFRYPHELSGGQKQRIGIARALAAQPKLLICDEPVSALDVSVQAQSLEFAKETPARVKLEHAFITHDISVVRFISDRLIVMNSGQVVEAR